MLYLRATPDEHIGANLSRIVPHFTPTIGTVQVALRQLLGGENYHKAINVGNAAHLSGFFRGLCIPDLGTERRLST